MCIRDRSHCLNVEWSFLKLFPLTALHFAAAGKNQGSVKRFALTRTRGLAVVEHTGIDCPEEGLLCGGIVYAAGDRLAVFGETDRDAEFGKTLHELTRAVEGIDDPDAF